MSVHVPTGFRAEVTTIAEWEGLLKESRMRLLVLAKSYYRYRFHEAVAGAIDLSLVDPTLDYGVKSAENVARENVKNFKNGEIIKSNLDFRFDVTMAVFRGNVYGFTQSRYYPLDELFIDNPLITPYKFDGSKPRPEGTDVESWEMKRAVWESIAGEKSPGIIGSTVHLVRPEDYFHTPEITLIDNSIVPFSARVNKAAFRLLFNELKAQMPDSQEGDLMQATLSGMDDYVARNKDAIEELLPREITVEMQTAPLSAISSFLVPQSNQLR